MLRCFPTDHNFFPSSANCAPTERRSSAADASAVDVSTRVPISVSARATSRSRPASSVLRAASLSIFASSTKSAAPAMRSGNNAVTPNTYLVPYSSINDPLKYALAIPPIATLPQQSDWSDPLSACDSPRALATTTESMTTSAKAVEREPSVNAAAAPGTSSTTPQRETPARAPMPPHRAR